MDRQEVNTLDRVLIDYLVYAVPSLPAVARLSGPNGHALLR